MNRLKLRHLVIIGVVLTIIGFVFGQFIPIEYLRPNIVNKDLTINDLWTRVLSLAGTTVTFLAVIVALFKEDIRKIWDRAELNISFRDDNTLHEIIDNETSSTNIRAKKYETILLVKNCGTLAAKNCEIILERLQFSSTAFPTPQDIPLTGQPLRWHNNTNSAIVIPATGKATVSIIEIISPESQSVTSEQAGNIVPVPKIRIGEIDSPDTFSNGKWMAKFIVYSENARPSEHLVTITWNNRWEHRLSEMSRFVTIQTQVNN